MNIEFEEGRKKGCSERPKYQSLDAYIGENITINTWSSLHYAKPKSYVSMKKLKGVRRKPPKMAGKGANGHLKYAISAYKIN